MATTPTRTLTFAEFEQLPTPSAGHYELHQGELIEAPPPTFTRVRVQKRLCDLLRPLAGEAGVVDKEIPFRALPEGEFQTADVVYLSKKRWESAGQYLAGSPELVIEVLSPSNRRPQLARKRQLCLENGAHEFWIVDTEQRSIQVSTPDGRTVTYRAGERVPVFWSADATIAIAEVFAAH